MDCVLLDYRLPDGDGLDCLRKIRQRHPDVPVIIITGAGSEEIAVEAMKLGATDYVVKHGKYVLTVPVVVREALGRRELAAPPPATATRSGQLGGRLLDSATSCASASARRIIGESPSIDSVLDMAERAAQSDATVLIEGETGPARSCSPAPSTTTAPARGAPSSPRTAPRSRRPPRERALRSRSRRFHRRRPQRRGLFEEAAGGTLFLDEVGR